MRHDSRGGSQAGPDAPSSRGLRAAVVAASFNEDIVAGLLEGAIAAFDGTGTPAADVRVVRVPGAFELPLAARALASSGQADAIVGLGCVIRGETAHYEHVARAAVDGLQRVSLDFGIPVGFGVLTTETEAQARDRAGGTKGNLGFDAAIAAIRMAVLLRDLA